MKKGIHQLLPDAQVFARVEYLDNWLYQEGDPYRSFVLIAIVLPGQQQRLLDVEAGGSLL